MLYLVTQIIGLLVLSLVAGFAMAWLLFRRDRSSVSRNELRDAKQALRDAEDERDRRPDAETIKTLRADLAARPTPGEAALLRAQIVDLERRLGLNRGAPTANHTAKIVAAQDNPPPPPPPAPPRQAPAAPEPKRQFWPDVLESEAAEAESAPEAPNNVIDLRPSSPRLPPMPVTGSGSMPLPGRVQGGSN